MVRGLSYLGPTWISWLQMEHIWDLFRSNLGSIWHLTSNETLCGDVTWQLHWPALTGDNETTEVSHWLYIRSDWQNWWEHLVSVSELFRPTDIKNHIFVPFGCNLVEFKPIWYPCTEGSCEVVESGLLASGIDLTQVSISTNHSPSSVDFPNQAWSISSADRFQWCPIWPQIWTD